MADANVFSIYKTKYVQLSEPRELNIGNDGPLVPRPYKEARGRVTCRGQRRDLNDMGTIQCLIRLHFLCPLYKVYQFLTAGATY